MDAGLRVIVPALRRLGVQRLDAIVVSHPKVSGLPATLTLEGGPVFWVATHRIHHQKSDKPGDPQKVDIPEDMKAAFEAAREDLLNAAAEHDDALVEKFLEDGDLTYDEIVQGIRIGVRDRTFFPVCAVGRQRDCRSAPGQSNSQNHGPQRRAASSISG